MTVREIRRYGDPVLLTVADELADFGDHTRALARDLLDTVQAPGRAGLAAPQIGVALRAFSYNVDDRLGVVFNPVLVATAGEQFGDEGCLSVPELWFPTRRSWYAAVEGFDQDGNERWNIPIWHHPGTLTDADLSGDGRGGLLIALAPIPGEEAAR